MEISVPWEHEMIVFSVTGIDGLSHWNSILTNGPSIRTEFVYNIDSHSDPFEGHAAIRSVQQSSPCFKHRFVYIVLYTHPCTKLFFQWRSGKLGWCGNFPTTAGNRSEKLKTLGFWNVLPRKVEERPMVLEKPKWTREAQEVERWSTNLRSSPHLRSIFSIFCMSPWDFSSSY